MDRIRALGLQVEDDPVMIGKSAQQLFIGRRQRLQDAQDQRGAMFAHGQFDLRHALGDGERTDQFAQRHEQGRNMRRQDRAGFHIGDVAAAFFMEADQHAPLALDLAHRQPGPMPVTPRFALNRRQDAFRTHATDMPKTVFQHALLGSKLCRGIHMLHRTTAADGEMRATWRDSRRRRLQDADQMGQFIVRLAPEAGIFDRFTR